MGKKKRAGKKKSPPKPVAAGQISDDSLVYKWTREDTDRFADVSYIEALQQRKEELQELDMANDDDLRIEWSAIIAELDSTLKEHHSPVKVSHSNMDITIGARVAVDGYNCDGTVRFVGRHATKGGDRVGIELDEPVGNNSGVVGDFQYFECRRNCGVLVVPEKVLSVAPIVAAGTLEENACLKPVSLRTFNVNLDLSSDEDEDDDDNANHDSDNVIKEEDWKFDAVVDSIDQDDATGETIPQPDDPDDRVPAANTLSDADSDLMEDPEFDTARDETVIRQTIGTTTSDATSDESTDDIEITFASPEHKASSTKLEWFSPQTPTCETLANLSSVQRAFDGEMDTAGTAGLNNNCGSREMDAIATNLESETLRTETKIVDVRSSETEVNRFKQQPTATAVDTVTLSQADVIAWLEENSLEIFEEFTEGWTGKQLFEFAEKARTDVLAIDQEFSDHFDLLSHRSKRATRNLWLDALLSIEPQSDIEHSQKSCDKVTHNVLNPSSIPSGMDLVEKFKSNGAKLSDTATQAPISPRAPTSSENPTNSETPTISETPKGSRYSVPRSSRTVSQKSDSGASLLEQFKSGRRTKVQAANTTTNNVPSILSGDLLQRYKQSASTDKNEEVSKPEMELSTRQILEESEARKGGNYNQDVHLNVSIDVDNLINISNRLHWDASKTDASTFPRWLGDQYGSSATMLEVGKGILSDLSGLKGFTAIKMLHLDANRLDSLETVPVLQSVEALSLKHNFLGKLESNLAQLSLKFPNLRKLDFDPQRLPDGTIVSSKHNESSVDPVVIMSAAHTLPTLQIVDGVIISDAIIGIWRLPKSAWNRIAKHLRPIDIVSFGAVSKFSHAVAKSMRCEDVITLTQSTSTHVLSCATRGWPLLKFSYKHHGAVDSVELAKLPSLYELQILGCPNITSFGRIDLNLVNISRRIRLERCNQLVDGKGLEDMDRVEFIDCATLNRVGMLNRTTALSIFNCPAVSTNDILYQLDLVPDLTVVGSKISAIGQLGGTVVSKSMVSNGLVREWKRSRLTLGICSKLRELRGIASVHTLKLFECENVVDVSPLKHVHTLELDGCGRIRDILPLAGCQRVTLRNLPRVDCVRALASCEYVKIENCDKVVDVSSLKSVNVLELVKCTGVTFVECNHNLMVVADQCHGLKNVSGSNTVQSLILRHCGAFSEFAQLNGAKQLDLHDFFDNIDLVNFMDCSHVSLSNCKTIENESSLGKQIDSVTIDGQLVNNSSRKNVPKRRLIPKETAKVVKPVTDTTFSDCAEPTHCRECQREFTWYLWASSSDNSVCRSCEDGKFDLQHRVDTIMRVASEKKKALFESFKGDNKQDTNATPNENDTVADECVQKSSQSDLQRRIDSIMSLASEKKKALFASMKRDHQPAKSATTKSHNNVDDKLVKKSSQFVDNVSSNIDEEEALVEPDASSPEPAKIAFIDPYEGMSDSEREAAMQSDEQKRKKFEAAASFEAFVLLGHEARKTREYEAAVTFFFKALETSRGVKGEISQEVANVYVNLGICYGQQKNYTKEMEYFRSALPIFQSVLGEKHIHVAMTLNNIGIASRNMGDFNKSMMYFNKALAIYCEVLGDDHEESIRTQRNIDRLVRIASTKRQEKQ